MRTNLIKEAISMANEWRGEKIGNPDPEPLKRFDAFIKAATEQNKKNATEFRALKLANWEQAELITELTQALNRMVSMHNLMMSKVNHGASFFNAECIQEMNEAPIQAKAALHKVGEIL